MLSKVAGWLPGDWEVLPECGSQIWALWRWLGEEGLNPLLARQQNKGWKAGSIEVCCSCRGPKLSSQHPYASPHLPIVLVPGHLTISPGIYRHLHKHSAQTHTLTQAPAHTWCTYTHRHLHTCGAHTHIHTQRCTHTHK